MLNKFQHGISFSETATHATAAVATHTGVAGATHIALTVTCSSDKSGSILLVKDGSSTIWQVQVGAGYSTITFPGGLSASVGNDISASIDGTSACKANIAGVTV